jgi:hypothetical protein
MRFRAGNSLTRIHFGTEARPMLVSVNDRLVTSAGGPQPFDDVRVATPVAVA